ncbi:hypothetical protein MUP77_23055, partial [Candidatus Bathyarchaeota archaeon]|nr:hypothetical protein [Candidatus Bathyarchaeota archaeon]
MVTFILSEAKRALNQYRAREDTADPQIVNFPSSAILELHHAIAMAAKKNVFQVVPFHLDSWQTGG